MRDISFIDKTYDSTLTNLYHLSIQIGLDGFSFCILDIPKGKYIVLKGYHFFLKRPRLLLKLVKEIFDGDEVLNHIFKSVEIVYATNMFTLIPDAFYQKNAADRFIAFNHVREKGFVTHKTFFPKAEAWCAYDLPENLNDYLISKYPPATFHHSLYPMVESALKSNRNHEGKQQVHLNFYRNYFEMAVVSGTKLILCNVFDYTNEKDVLYYVLYAFDQLKLPAETTELIVHGQISQVAPLYHLFKKYIKRTSFAKPNSMFSYSYTFSQVPEHYYTSLFDVYKCE
jgi:hypothetical protein